MFKLVIKFYILFNENEKHNELYFFGHLVRVSKQHSDIFFMSRITQKDYIKRFN